MRFAALRVADCLGSELNDAFLNTVDVGAGNHSGDCGDLSRLAFPSRLCQVVSILTIVTSCTM